MTARFGSAGEVDERLRAVGYLATPMIASVAFLADRLAKPILAEGPAGVGKTELAKALAAVTGSRLIRLQCYEGLDESKALYEWNYKKQLLRIQADRAHEATWADVEADIFSEPFLLTRPLLEAVRATDPVLLLIDEVDRVEVETEALLLEVLSDFQVSIPELGTITPTRKQRPLVVLTSNNTRELSEALRRRCLYLHIDYPDLERERQIVRTRVPELDAVLASKVAELVSRIRRLDLKKSPSISETIDWARSLLHLQAGDLDQATVEGTLHVLLKHERDLDHARDQLRAAAERATRPAG
jgi:MoxR-like ATPase